MSKHIAVLISDVHYTISTLEVADKAMRKAIEDANELKVPLIVCGDLHDSKAIIRGECIKAMIETFKTAEVFPIVLRGNHDSINEKSSEHSLEFLAPYASIIKHIGDWKDWILLPYHHDVNELRSHLKLFPDNSKIIMHQGLNGSASGEYIRDHSALSKEDVARFRVISGHYHKRQTLKTKSGRLDSTVGLWSYVGNPYTLTFGEANDPEKGYQILMEDGSLEFRSTNLRKHVIYNVNAEDTSELLAAAKNHNPGDLIWVKVSGTKEELSKVKKYTLADILGVSSFKLDLIPHETKAEVSEQVLEKYSNEELLDVTIKSLTHVSDEQKERLMTMWKDLL